MGCANLSYGIRGRGPKSDTRVFDRVVLKTYRNLSEKHGKGSKIPSIPLAVPATLGAREKEEKPPLSTSNPIKTWGIKGVGGAVEERLVRPTDPTNPTTNGGTIGGWGR